MLLKVMYQNDKYDMVRPLLLNELIASKKIKKFYRSGGWANIEKDLIRRRTGGLYGGIERRKQSSLSSRLMITLKEINYAR